jgi:hypothetical protein
MARNQVGGLGTSNPSRNNCVNGRIPLWRRHWSNLRIPHYASTSFLELSDIQDFLRRFAQQNGDSYKFSNVREGLIVGLLSIGCLIGSLLAAPFSDKIGRRLSMILGCIVFYVGNTIQITTFNAWYQLAIGRLICGLSVGALSGIIFHNSTDHSPRPSLCFRNCSQADSRIHGRNIPTIRNNGYIDIILHQSRNISSSTSKR